MTKLTKTQIKELLENMTETFTFEGEETINYKFGKTVRDDEELKNDLLNDPFNIQNEYYDLFDTFCDNLIDYMNFDDMNDRIDVNELAEFINMTVSEMDIEADVYTKDLTSWLNSNINHVSYLDNATNDMGFGKLQYAQIMWKEEIYHHFVCAIMNFFERME